MTAMEQIAKVSILARNAGLSYGEYVKKFGSPFPPPVSTLKLKEGERVCSKCGESYHVDFLNGKTDCARCGGELSQPFDPGLTKSGKKSQRTICFKCEEASKVGKPKPMGLRKVKEYAVKCSRCGDDMITRRAPSPDIPNYCTDCREIVNRERSREKYEKKKAGRRKDG